MPIVNVQGFGTVQFPDEMAPDAIEAAIRADIEPLIDQRRRIAAGQAAAQLPPVSPNWEGVKGAARRTLADPLLSAAKGIVGVPEAAVGVADILTGGGAGKLAESAGVNFKGAQDILSGLLSPEQQAANARVQQAKGFFPTVQAALENPSTIAHQVIEATPSMLAGGAVARGAVKALPKLSPLAAGAIGEGAITAGQMAEQVRQEQPSKLLTWEQAGLSLAGGTLTGAIGGASGKLAERLGIKNLETILAGGGDLATKRGRLAQVIGGALTEGAIEELPQSAQEQVVQNLAQGKPWNEGVAEAAASGLLAGMAMGAGFNALDAPPVPKTGTAQPPVTPDVTPPAKDAPKLDAAALKAAMEGNRLKPEAPPVTPDVTPPTPAPPAGPLRFRAIVAEGKVPSELVIQPLTEELYDAVIHVPGLTPDFDQFKAENPEATHLKRQLLPTGKFASGHKFGALNELVPPGIGSKWEDITNPEPSTKNQAPPAPTSPPPPAAAVPPPAAPAPPAPAAAVSPAPATAQTPQALPSSPAGDSLAAPLTPPAAAPTVSPELADTIQALRQGYQQQLDVPAETSNVQRPTSKPAELMTPAEWAEANLSPGLLKLAKESVADQQDLLQPYVDAIREAVKAGRTLSAAAWEAGTRAGWPSKLEAKAQSYRWKDGFYSPTSKPTAPDQSGGPTELTPPAKGKRKAKAKPTNEYLNETVNYGSEVPALRADTGSAVGTASQKRAEQQDGGAFSRRRASPEQAIDTAAANADRELASRRSARQLANIELVEATDRDVDEEGRLWSLNWKPPESDKWMKPFVPSPTITENQGEFFLDDEFTGYATLDEAAEAGREKIREAVKDQRGTHGSDMDGQEFAGEVFAAWPTDWESAEDGRLIDAGVPGVRQAGWFKTKWGSWYLEGRFLDESGEPTEAFKISVRDHDVSRKDMGPVDKAFYVSKQWNPSEVAEALKQALKWLRQKANAPVAGGAAGIKTPLGSPEADKSNMAALQSEEGSSLTRENQAGGEASVNSRAEAAADPAVSVASAQARADELTARWVLPFGVEVVQSWRDLPARAQRGITEQDGHTVEGRYVPGSGVFLVADNLASPDRVAAVVLHEVLGHFGIDTVLGEQRDAFMLDVFRSFQGTPLFQQKVRDYAGDFENGRTPVTQADKILLGRELVAALAENPAENPGLWQRIVDAVRRWLRDIGWVQDVTEADIREALRRADRELRGVRSEELGVRSPGLVKLGGGVLMTPGAQLVDVRPDALAALTAHHGTPHKVDKFTTAKIGTGEGAQVYGWGLYFAENPQVAQTYADTLGLQVKVKGQQVYRGIDGKTAGNAPISSGAIGLLQGKDWNLKAAQEEATARAAEIKDDPWFQKLADELQTIKEADIEIGGGATYTVTLNVEPEDLLDWDKPLSEQSEKVREGFFQAYGSRFNPAWDMSGSEMYRMLMGGMSDSEFDYMKGEVRKRTNEMLQAGIKGIRYLDQGSRGWKVALSTSAGPYVTNTFTDKMQADNAAARAKSEGFTVRVYQEGTYNYVIFNEDDIRITHENGQPVAPAAFSRTTQPTEPLPDLLARRDDAAARGITYAAQREKLRSEGKTIPESLKKAEREQADIFKEAMFQLMRHPDYVAQQVRAVDAKLDELNTLKERQRILKQQGTDLESDARARLAELEQWLPIETGEIPYGNADEFVGIPPSLVKQTIERTSGLKHFVTEAEKERVRAILDNPDLSPEQKNRLLADLERNRGRALAEVPLPNALPSRANVALATSTTLAGNQDARTWWESFARWARNLASATPEIPLFGPLARLNVPMRGFLNAIRAGNMTAARDAEAMVQDVVQPLLALPRTQLDPNALARHQAIARKLQAAERQFDQQAERMRAEIAAMEQMRADRAAITERREALAEFEGNPPAKIAELQKQLAEAVDKLGTNPMWLFKQAVLFRDYVSRFQMLAPKQQGRFKFPGNLSIQDVVNELERTNAAIEASPARAAIKEAMDRHYRAMAELEAELLKRGHIIPEAMKNGAYFPHQVLDYTSQHLGRLKPATEAPFRGYLVDPTGSRKAIETDYIQAIYRHAAEVMAHNSHQDAVEKFLKPWDKSDSIRETVAAKAAAEGRTAGRFEWRSEDNLPPGYVFYDAAKKLPLRLGYVMDPQTIADALGIALKDGDVIEQMRKLGVDFVVEPEMLQQALVAGEKQPWVIPKEMAEALDGILERQRQEDAIARAPVTRRLRQAVALWKLNTLFAPWHYLRYEWGNTMSDVVDKLGGADPGMAKYLPQAFREVIAFADRKEATKDIRAAFEQRVLDTITFAEVEKVKDSPAFEQLRSDTQRALGMVGTAAKNITFPPLPIIRLLSGANVRSTVELSRLREATFRYAKFLADLNRIRNGERPVYAGAYWKDVEAERTPEEKAAFIARRTFGDYGDLSVTGEYLRRNLVPFWSWTEINFRYHANLLRNMADMIRKGEFGDAAQSARAIAAWTALRLALPYAAVHLWNTVGGAMAGAWDDDDDLEATLSDADRRRFHLILGKDERGQTKVIYMPTAFSDVVSWFGGDNAARLLAEYARGDITFERVVGDFAKQIGPDMLNKVAQSTGPIGKGAFIAVSGKQPFPDITNMRSVGGREKWFAVVQTMTDREGTDLLRRAFDNDYYPRPAGEVAQQLILQIRRRDPEQWAFYEVKEKVSAWKEQKTGKRFEAGDYQAPEAQALRGFRRAVYLGDVDAAERFYNRLLGFGYTSERLKASIRNQHPLAELNEEGRKEFIKGLSRADREQLRRALQYWERLSTLKGKERGLFPSKPVQRFTPQPERLRNAVESFDRRSDEDVERTARRLMDAALTGRR